ncbi:MAG: DNA alkylation repair protein [Candidatus Bathyarchaeota archaeon]|nr:DNA alkylation repair protein [Candidatus Termiticorpusculum sp.]
MVEKTGVSSPVGESFQIKEGEPLKNILNQKTLHEGALVIKSVYNPFKVDEFVNSILDKNWDSLELKARGRQVTLNLGKYLPTDYKEALSILEKITLNYTSGLFVLGFSFPDFVEVYGQDEDNWNLSVSALEKFTTYWSAEMAVRPFILKHEERMMAQMLLWAKHENEHVRRLASEGCRPALPWAMALPKFKKDPTPIIPILTQLKADPSMYVRKSVANNLNDISKTRPDIFIKIASDWYGKNNHTNWIIKHGSRTLLKKGNNDILTLLGLNDNTNVTAENFSLDTTAVSIGNTLTFSFTITAKKTTKARLEYAIDYVKSRGSRNRKIFQISEVSLKANEKKHYVKTHSFANLSTRKHFPGTHSISLIINGTEQKKTDFEVTI